MVSRLDELRIPVSSDRGVSMKWLRFNGAVSLLIPVNTAPLLFWFFPKKAREQGERSRDMSAMNLDSI